MNPIVFTRPGMQEVQVHAALPYSPHAHARLLDAYVPNGLAQGERRPAVLLIHGGVAADAQPRTWPVFESWGRLLAASGLVGIAFDHRLGFPKAELALAGLDVAEAIAYVRAHADALHVDRERIALFAFSAGGPLLGVGLGEDTRFVRCLVAYYALLDIRQSPLHAEEGPPPFLRRFSPAARYGTPDAHAPPILVARAGRDMPMLNRLTDAFITDALAANAPLTLVNHPAGEHGFDASSDDDRSREIIAATLGFLRTHLLIASGEPPP